MCSACCSAPCAWRSPAEWGEWRCQTFDLWCLLMCFSATDNPHTRTKKIPFTQKKEVLHTATQVDTYKSRATGRETLPQQSTLTWINTNTHTHTKLTCAPTHTLDMNKQKHRDRNRSRNVRCRPESVQNTAAITLSDPLDILANIKIPFTRI